MRIKKIYQGELPENKILNVQSESSTDTYSCDYINNLGVGGGDSLDELPIGSVIRYDGEDIPEGWEEVEDSSNNVYSTEETIIGTWIDGKPIYRKVIKASATTIPQTIVTNATNVDDLITGKFQVQQSTSKDAGWRILPWVYNANLKDEYGVATWVGGWYFNGATGTLYTQVGSDIASIQKYIIILEYTKTTD